jgi:hypothetical protein
MPSSPLAGLDQFQGVWFPTYQSDDGRLWAVHEPAFPSPGGTPWLLTVQGDAFHVTANSDYYATGGRVRLGPEPDRLTFVYGMVPAEYAEYHGRFAYRLDGDELHLQSGGLRWSRPGDWVTATRYVRVAAEPSPAMAALIDEVMRGWWWTQGCEAVAAEPSAAPDAGRGHG